MAHTPMDTDEPSLAQPEPKEDLPEIRNPNTEIRKKSETRNSKGRFQ
jgi:hypothetical protein